MEVSGDLDGPDGHFHDVAVVVVGPVGLGVGAGAGVVVVTLLGFTTTLFGQDKFGGLFALYLGAVVVGVLGVLDDAGVLGAVVGLVLLSNVTVGPGPSYGSSEAGLLLNNLIMSCDKPFGWLELVLAEAELVVEAVGLADVCGRAGARVGGPVRVLVDDVEVLECVGFD